jgi:hypothetical protein
MIRPRKPTIVEAAVAMIVFELIAMNTHTCRTWTDHARARDKGSLIIWGYWLWLGAHLITGGKV